MKLSEALRKGCEMAPVQTQVDLLKPSIGGACALGAIGLAIAGPAMAGENSIQHTQRVRKAANAAVQAAGLKPIDIWCRNDGYGFPGGNWKSIQPMTREEIADWLEEHGL